MSEPVFFMNMITAYPDLSLIIPPDSIYKLALIFFSGDIIPDNWITFTNISGLIIIDFMQLANYLLTSHPLSRLFISLIR